MVKFELEYMEDEGYILVTKQFIFTCQNCMVKLDYPFYICETTKKVLCPKCNKKVKCPFMKIQDDNHLHYKIIKVREVEL